MSEKLRPTLKVLRNVSNLTLNSLGHKTVGDRIHINRPIVGIYPVENQQPMILYCFSSSEENCHNCALYIICPRPANATAPLHRNSIPFETAEEFIKYNA